MSKRMLTGGNVYGVLPRVIKAFASLVYKDPMKRTPNYYGYSYIRDFSDYDIAVYHNRRKDITIFSCRGTDPFSISDLYQDAIIALKDEPSGRRVSFAILTFIKVFKMFNTDENSKFILTGHSLGGNIASLVYKYAEENLLAGDPSEKISIVVYNRGTTPLAKLFDDSTSQDDRFHHHIRGDLLSFGFLNDRSFNHFVYPAASYINPIANHVLSAFDRQPMRES